MDERAGKGNTPERAARALEDFAARMVVRPDAEFRSYLDQAAVALFEEFDDAGVTSLLLKGAGLERLLYTQDEHRAYVDVDVLVAPANWDLSREVLFRMGYNPASDGLGIDDVGGVVHEEGWVTTEGASPGALLIELHRWFPGSRVSPEVAWPALAARETWIDLCGRAIPVLDRDGQAMHLALHVAQHGPGFARGMRELALALERWPVETWARAATLASAIEAADAFAGGLCLLPEGAHLASTLGLHPTARTTWKIENAHLRPRGTFHLEALLGAQGVMGRLRVLRLALLPRRQWILAQYPWAARASGRIPVAYVLHLMRAPRWAVRSWSFRRRARRARL